MDKNTPQATPSQKKEMDILMNELGVDSLQMMELAGRDIARVIMKHSKGPVLFFCGKGNNGGDGLCAAKHLINCNIPVAIILVEDEKKYKGTVKKQLVTLKKLNASIFRWGLPDLEMIMDKTKLVVDAMVGYGLKSEPRGNVKKAISLINEHDIKILSIDVPTGIDPLSGNPYENFLKANYVVALGIPSRGIINNKNTGKVYVTDIGIPDKVYSAVKLENKPRFHKKSIIKL